MYEAFFGLKEKPFSLLPDPTMLYLGEKHSLAYSMLEYGLLHQAGFTVVTGEIGCGKTTLVRHLLNEIPKNLTVGLMNNTRTGPDELLQWVMLALGQPYQETTRVALFEAFTQFLIDEYAHNRHVILIVDEAQNLDIDTLEELRMLSNINADKNMVLQIILIGQPQLRDKLSHPDLVQFTQRIAVNFHLGPLSAAESRNYIRHRLELAGGDPVLFADDTFELIYQASKGTPRVINLICDTALIYAFAEEKQQVDAAIVNSVLRDRSNTLPAAQDASGGSGLYTSSSPGNDSKTGVNQEDASLSAWLNRPLDDDFPYVFLVRLECPQTQNNAQCDSLLTAFGVDSHGYRKVLGIQQGTPDKNHGWGRLLRNLADRGLNDTQLFICDASDELIGDIMDIFPSANWQRDLDIYYNEILAKVPTEQQPQVKILLKVIHAQSDSYMAASKADEIFQELAAMNLTQAATLLASYAHESLAYYDHPATLRKQIKSASAFQQVLQDISKNLEGVTPLPSQSSRKHLFAAALMHLEQEEWESMPYLSLLTDDKDTASSA